MYRQSAHVSCLICKNGPLEADGDGFRCINGCGLWDPSIPRPDGTSLAAQGSVVEHQLHPRTCPICRNKMQIRRWAGLTFDACAGHGIWVAGDDIGHYRHVTGT